MTAVLLSCLLSGDCATVQRVKVRTVAVQQAYVAPVVAHDYAYANAIYAYRVDDPEIASLRRQNEVLTQAVVEQLRDRTGEVQRLRGDPTIEKQTAKPDVPMLLKTNCIACHAGAKAKGDFLLPEQHNLASRIIIGEMVGSGKMPPTGKLTDAEKQAIVDWASPTRDELKKAANAAK